MKYTLSWQDFMRQPENKVLKESKGIHACKQKFIQEQNRLMWHDPVIIQENQSPGQSVTSNAAANYGGSTQFITGHTNQASTFTFDLPLGNNLYSAAGTGSGLDGAFFDIQGYDGTTDFSRNHTDSKKTFRVFFTSQSVGDFAPTIPATIHGVITASSRQLAGNIAGLVNPSHTSASLNFAWQEAINNQAAGAVVAGYTNTIAPSTLFSALTSSAGSVLTITNVHGGSVNAISTTITSTTGSVATTVSALDTFHNEKGVQIFDGARLPYASMPRKY
tara:strand:+ start:1874 stop:2701 length:828 start_codon:yes stop_codon:yes gene_type:complete